MRIGIPKEIYPEERRVAATPETTEKLIKLGFEVSVEAGAGTAASFFDQAYEKAGAQIVADPAELWAKADIVLKVRAPMQHPSTGKHEAELLREGGTLISFIFPAQNEALLQQLAARKATVLAMDAVPRTTRAQAVDALSSTGNIAGYRAVIEAANEFGSFFTGQMTAGGRVPPAKVLVIGAGVAGLAALGAARGLGAICRAFDTRAAVKDQVKSMGAEFLEVQIEESGEGGGGYAKVMSKEFIDAEMALFRKQAADVDIVITTALIPGKPAPKLWLADMVEKMKPGSVVVDLAAEQGGNCDLTKPGQKNVEHGVKILGYTDMPSRLGTTASQLYGTNMVNLLKMMGGAEGYKVDFDDEVIRGATVLREGEVTWPPPKIEPAPAAVAKPAAAATPAAPKQPAPPPKSKGWVFTVALLALAGLWSYLRFTADPGAGANDATVKFVQHLTVFVLSCFIGWHVVWSVTPALHTPLMSVTNAISGIIIIGGLLEGAKQPLTTPVILGLVAILVAMINVAGGFVVTQRMLRMFRKN